MQFKGLTLDKFQEDSIKAIDANKSVVVSAPTGSGKTLIADYIINRDIKKGKRVVYTAPIKALSNQKYKDFCAEYGEDQVGLLTGDIVRNPSGRVLIMTTEIYRNMVLVGDESISDISYVIFDEIHYISDVERGHVWEESIIFSRENVRMLCLSATIPNAQEFADWIQAIKKHEVLVVEHHKRAVPLEVSFFDAELGIASLEEIKDISDVPEYSYVVSRGRRRRQRRRFKSPSHIDLAKQVPTPCLFFCYSRKGTQDKSKELWAKNVFKQDPSIAAFVRQKLEEASPEIKNLHSTQLLRKVLPYGIGFHHAGLIPITKNIVEELFGAGKLKVLYATETFAVGINMPAKTVCFESLRKFDGIQFRMLNSKEFFQAAGRAGRRGMDKVGYVFPMIDRRDFEYKKIKSITTSDTDPIVSQYRLTANAVLNLIDQHTREEVNVILSESFFSYQKYGIDFLNKKNDKAHRAFDNFCKKLRKLDYIHEWQLTDKGRFASKIYSDEIVLGEIFSTAMYHEMNEYQMLLVLGALCYEPRERTQFKKRFPSGFVNKLKGMIREDAYLSKEKRFLKIDTVTAMMHPCYHGQSVFDIIENTTLLEGDIIRFFRQVLDRIGQIKNATQDLRLKAMMDNCQELITICLRDIDVL